MKVEWQTGVVRLSNPARGFHFLALDGRAERGNIFLHASAIGEEVHSGDWVEFLLCRGPDGRLRAQQARKIGKCDA